MLEVLLACNAKQKVKGNLNRKSHWSMDRADGWMEGLINHKGSCRRSAASDKDGFL